MQAHGTVRSRVGESFRCVILLAASLPVAAQSAPAQSTEDLPDSPTPVRASDHDSPGAPSVRRLPLDIGKDQIRLVTFPAHLSKSSLRWVLPLTGATVAAFALDEKTMAEVVSSNPSFNDPSRNVSDGLRYGFVAVPVGLFGVGHFVHDDHAREAGLLGSEAIVDAEIANHIIKLASFRERPSVDRSEGSFYRLSAGTDSSFISGHSMDAWASAAVLAEEYPGRWRRIGIYTLASGVSLTRVLGQEHFPSDVLLGSAAGWFIGHYVYKARHSKAHNSRAAQ